MAEAGPDLATAVSDFWRARRRANMREALSFFRRAPNDLLSYEDVRRQLRAVESAEETKLEDVPLDKIVGSVGRYNDFTRGFLPRQDSDRDRWAGVKQAMTGLEGVPPIEVYRIGDAYFVKDGNHRVSVARQLGARYLQAYVTPVHTRVDFGPDDDPDDIILKAEYADFLIETRIDELRPQADLILTEPGGYEKLLEHISVHRYFMGLDQDRPIPYYEAVAHWYDVVYLPVADSIRRNGLLRGFPGRTEADLYLWLAEHRQALEEELGWSLPPETIAQGVAAGIASSSRLEIEQRERVVESALGQEEAERVCEDVLIALPGPGDAAVAVEQAIVVARREGSRIYGLHSADEGGEEEVKDLFERLSRDARVPAQFATTRAPLTDELLSRAPWSDLVIVPVPSQVSERARLSADLRAFLRRSPRPVLTVNGRVSPLSKALLAYDGGPRATAALYIAAYLAAKWAIPLVVLTVAERTLAPSPSPSPLERAREYLESHGIEAEYVTRSGRRIAPTIVATAREEGCDLILMGSYKYNRWLESVLGGVVDETVREFSGAVLVA